MRKEETRLFTPGLAGTNDRSTQPRITTVTFKKKTWIQIWEAKSRCLCSAYVWRSVGWHCNNVANRCMRLWLWGMKASRARMKMLSYHFLSHRLYIVNIGQAFRGWSLYQTGMVVTSDQNWRAWASDPLRILQFLSSKYIASSPGSFSMLDTLKNLVREITCTTS